MRQFFSNCVNSLYGEIPLFCSSKCLRFLESLCFLRLGSMDLELVWVWFVLCIPHITSPLLEKIRPGTLKWHILFCTIFWKFKRRGSFSSCFGYHLKEFSQRHKVWHMCSIHLIISMVAHMEHAQGFPLLPRRHNQLSHYDGDQEFACKSQSGRWIPML